MAQEQKKARVTTEKASKPELSGGASAKAARKPDESGGTSTATRDAGAPPPLPSTADRSSQPEPKKQKASQKDEPRPKLRPATPARRHIAANDDLRGPSRDQHHAIFDAISAGKAEEAATILRQHVEAVIAYWAPDLQSAMKDSE